MASRGQKIMNALAKRDEEIMDDLSIPIFDTTKGSTARERQSFMEMAGTSIGLEHIGDEALSTNCSITNNKNYIMNTIDARRTKVFEEEAPSSTNYKQDILKKEPTSTPVSRGKRLRRKRKRLFDYLNENKESDDSESSIKPIFDDDSDDDRHWFPEEGDVESSDDSTECVTQPKKKKEKSRKGSNTLYFSSNSFLDTKNSLLHEQSQFVAAEKSPLPEQDFLVTSDNIEQPEQEEINQPTSDHSKKRDWSKKSCCLFCGKCFSKIPRHWERKHANELEVSKILAQPLGSKRKFDLIQELKNKGNFLHNSEVIKCGKGTLIPKKVPAKEEKNDTSSFIPCLYCRAFFKKGSLASHIKHCKSKKDEPHTSKTIRNIQSQAALLLPSPVHVNSRFKLEVFGKMKLDLVYREIRADELIVQYGSQLYDKHGDENHLHSFIAQKMREIGRFMVVLKGLDNSINSLEDCFSAKKVHNIIDSINKVAGFDSDKRYYKTPSLVLKLAGSLKKCAQIAVGNALRLGNESQKIVLENFIRLFSQEIQLLTFRSLKTLKRRKWNKPPLIPLANDVSKLNSLLKKEGDDLIREITDIPTKESLSKLAENTLATITCFNRKRIGEVERMPLHESTNVKIGGLTSDVLSTLTDTEKQLVQCLGRVEVRGKTGRKVAILITSQIKKQIDLLCRPMNRKIMGISDESIYLFASKTDPEKSLRGCDVLRKYAYKCGAEKPENITSTKLRKHLATMSQVMNLNKNELDILANFMGHDIRVHRQFYRLPEDVLQIAKVSKVLLNLEKGRSDLLVGNNLDSVNIEEKETAMDEDDSEEEDEEPLGDQECCEENFFETSHRNSPSTSSPLNYTQNHRTVLSVGYPPTSTITSASEIQINRNSNNLHQQSETQQTNRPTGNQKKGRAAWTEEENNAIFKYFDRFIMHRSLPGKTDCEKSQLAYPVLQNRPWSQIKFKIKNILSKQNGA